MEDKKLNASESLELISQMIKNTQQKLERNAGFPFLLWGYATFIISVVVWYLLKTTGNSQWNWLWFALPIICYPIMLLHQKKRNKTKLVKTYIDSVIHYIWITLAISSIFVCFNFVSIFSGGAYNYIMPALFGIVLIMGIGTAITGFVIKFKPCIFSGFAGIVLSQLCLIKSVDSIIIFAVIFLIMMIVPGHILNYKARKQCLKN